jgi:5-oxoprolinase (ATP-hydrolysing)
MGALLQRTALSTNIRERLDFSCALLTPHGQLISSAPHIPVHLGALGVCVREVTKIFPPRRGDTIITNHPAYGGSHLPDVTLITPVFADDGTHLGFVANRAHHAEIGGLSPGSMPANATSLIEEGVVIPPMLLSRDDVPDFTPVETLLKTSPHPTRALADNLADLHAQLAANRLGAQQLREVSAGVQASACSLNEEPTASNSRPVSKPKRELQQTPKPPHPLLIAAAMILDESRRVMQRFIATIPEGSATEALDDGSIISVRIGKQPASLIIDFTGTSPQHPGNLNATPAIVRSAVLYVLRLALQEDLPLNEGLLADVDIVLPEGSLLNPRFAADAAACPAVVGGNVEVSQRLVDTLIKALRLQACSQGTMNNFLFGSDTFGYYETICGGAGAGDGCHGASALHTHMTNTAITDPEVIERRYPVRLREFSIRRDSGGKGTWHGGDGVIREFEFLAPLSVSLLTQHRASGPFGINGGGNGKPGRQTLLHTDGSSIVLPSSTTLIVQPSDRIRIETPGGGALNQTS